MLPKLFGPIVLGEEVVCHTYHPDGLDDEARFFEGFSLNASENVFSKLDVPTGKGEGSWCYCC